MILPPCLGAVDESNFAFSKVLLISSDLSLLRKVQSWTVRGHLNFKDSPKLGTPIKPTFGLSVKLRRSATGTNLYSTEVSSKLRAVKIKFDCNSNGLIFEPVDYFLKK